jgi:CDGSH-type Zn-finger protein/truncated hemoglobin YjbI
VTHSESTANTPGPVGGQGKLAQILATRGGKAAPEEPFVIEHREALIYMLCDAAELEHAIMCQYLFAAFSLKQSTDEGLTEAELESVSRWRREIAHVASQEMLHMALVQNLLSAIGAAPHLSRPNLPHPANHYPAGVRLALLPFGEPALRHFMFLERPEGMALHDADGLEAVRRAEPHLDPGDIVPRLQDFATIGHLYRSIEGGLSHLTEKNGERSLFIGSSRVQATQPAFPWPELIAVTDLESARQAIETILDQGEGPRGDWKEAHFGRFVNILDEYQTMRDSDPEFEPVRPVLVANVRPTERPSDVPLITDPFAARCTDLFNVGYEILLLTLERYFAHTDETDAQLSALADVTLQLMLRVLRPMGELLSTLPAGSNYPGQTVGASFELFYEGDYLMPHRGTAWIILEERLREAAAFCAEVQTDAEKQLVDSLAPVMNTFVELADSLAAHGSDAPDHISTYPEPSTSTPAAAQVQDSEGLLARIDEIASQVPGIEPESGANDLQCLFVELVDLAQAFSAPNGDKTALGTDVGQVLTESVLRPAVGAFRAPPGDDVRSRADQDSDWLGIAAKAGKSAPDRLWELTKAATRLRARSHAAKGLIEAVSGLQRLALRPGPQRDLRMTELVALQGELSGGIQTAVDGPYLVTNADSLSDHLGCQIQTTPQMALCRCGESATKPFCDGSHARIGFSGSKDPKRIPDRRDTYVGQQVTILDNRGICAHSGFCTDRLSSVFHTESDPFVTPSGGRMDEIIRAARACPSGALSIALDGEEIRDHIDLVRSPVIEVSKDGPYRITGGVPLIDAEGKPEVRAVGASNEHFSLCRCGHSQNKPFCSGMHWYVEFHDPVPDPDREPTVFEWCGGLPALTRMTRIFYEKHVPEDPLLAPLFANMSADHPERVAAWLGEVFGGPKSYSDVFGGYTRMISEHLGKEITEDKRARWVELLQQSAREARMPNDPEFRSVFGSYIEWGSRLAVENSQAGARPPENMPMPHWDWNTAAGPPDGRVSALASAPDDEPPIVLPGSDEILSFTTHIKALFRQRDRQSMKFAFDLWSCEDVRTQASEILERLKAGSMPCDGAWPPEQVQVFERWVKSGMPA